MNTKEGYSKRSLTDICMLMSGGGHKTLLEVIAECGAVSVPSAWSFATPISGDLLGNATTADRFKQTTLIGAATIPIYFSNGIPIAGALLGASAYHADSYFALASHGLHVTFSTSGTPLDLGTATNGTSGDCARADHVHKKPSLSDLGAAAFGHTHGNITNDGKMNNYNSSTDAEKFLKADGSWAIPSYIANTDITSKWNITANDSLRYIGFSPASVTNGTAYETYYKLVFGFNPANNTLVVPNILALGTVNIDSLTAGNLVISGASSLGIISSGTWQGSPIAINYLPLATNSTPGIILVGSTLSTATGYTACPIKDGVVYYKNEVHTSDTYNGTVTSVATGTGLTGGTITSSGTISIDSIYLTYISHGEAAYTALNLASADVTNIVDRWDEVVNFLSTVTESDTLASVLSHFVTTNTSLTIEGAKTFSLPISGDLLGNSTTADRLKTSTQIGNNNIPVYFSNGFPIAVSYDLSTISSNASTGATHASSTHAPTDAQKNVQSDWNATSGDALILNKPTIPTSLPANGGNADTVDNLHAHDNRNNEANKLVRTDASGYIQAGWINTTSGGFNGAITGIDRIYCSEDTYLRYLSPSNFIAALNLVTTNSTLTISGNKSFDGSILIASLTVGNLLISGSSNITPTMIGAAESIHGTHVTTSTCVTSFNGSTGAVTLSLPTALTTSDFNTILGSLT